MNSIKAWDIFSSFYSLKERRKETNKQSVNLISFSERNAREKERSQPFARSLPPSPRQPCWEKALEKD